MEECLSFFLNVLDLDFLVFNVNKQMEKFNVVGLVFFYVLGLLVIDIVFGYDYIIFVIGAVMVGWYGMVMLCYVILKEYLGLFDVEDVRNGLIVYKIAVYAVDIGWYCQGVRDRDDEFFVVCYNFDWNC